MTGQAPSRPRPRPATRGSRALVAAVAWAVLLVLVLAPLAIAQSDADYGEREDGVHIVDQYDAFDDLEQTRVEEELIGYLEGTGIDIVVYTQQKARPGARRDARAEAEALLEAWDVGGESGRGVVMFWNISRDGSIARNGIAIGDGFTTVDAAELDENVNRSIRSALGDSDWLTALTLGWLALEEQLADEPVPTQAPDATAQPRATPGPARTTTSTAASGRRPTEGWEPGAGPPFPDPSDGVTVYDFAEVIDPATIDELQRSIAAIEERTGAEIVIYTQRKPEADNPEATERDAIALIDQWGVGRAGFDDGMAIFFNLRDDCHGQVQLYAAPGYRAAYLTNEERQAIFEQQMLPALRACDFDTALTAAMAEIDAKATAEHARTLQVARQVDAMAGLVVAPLVLIGLVGWAGWSWLRYGRDPMYLDDDSILMPAPPPGMSPAAAAAVIDGRAGRHALTTALVELAARGEISFRTAEDDPRKVDIDITVPDQRDARLARNRRRPPGEAERYALEELRKLGGAKGTIESDDVPDFAKAVDGFEDRLDDTVAANGWFSEAPGDAIDRWSRRAAVVLVAGIAGIFGGIVLPSNGLLMVGVATVVAAVAMFIIARTMPQRTMEGARMYAQLAAYRRTLQRTLEQSRTMDQVVSSKVLPWVETPDQAMVWSYALGLHEEAEEVLERSMEDVRTGGASPTRTYFPLWFGVGPRAGARISGGARAPTAGLFSAGVVPDFTSMTAALSTIGSPPASSGGSGGFSGGSSGGGGGGAGGGF